MDLTKSHVLVVRPGALGDAVLTLPVLLALQKVNVKRITILGTPSSWAFLSDTPPCRIKVEDFGAAKWLGLFADGAALSPEAQTLLKQIRCAVVFVGGHDDALERTLKAHGVETILRMQPPTGDRPQVVRKVGARYETVKDAPPFPIKRSGLKSSEETISGVSSVAVHAAEQLLSLLVPIVPKPHRLAALKPFHTFEKNTFLKFEGRFPQRILTHFELFDLKQDFVVLHPGSGGRRKCWADWRYLQVAEEVFRRGILPVLFFGPAEEELRGYFHKNLSPALAAEVKKRDIFCRPLRELLALLTKARGYAGNDSGVSHLAAQACPVTAIFGPTDPRIWAPLGRDVQVLRAPEGALDGIKYETVVEALLR
jgi:ADP-heptose:LPS heptosyltransferase